ncbi:hypothetical protein IMSAG013_01631 [Clostridiales bacterium]|nr:hypothetical protein IMSAG013_01631 [Clostridiales bacterium]
MPPGTDFYTVGEILGHTLKDIGMSLGISSNLEAVTAQYVDVRLERKKGCAGNLPQSPAPAKGRTRKRPHPKRTQPARTPPRKQKREAAEWSYEGRISLQLRAAFYMFLGNPCTIRAPQKAREKP